MLSGWLDVLNRARDPFCGACRFTAGGARVFRVSTCCLVIFIREEDGGDGGWGEIHGSPLGKGTADYGSCISRLAFTRRREREFSAHDAGDREGKGV